MTVLPAERPEPNGTHKWAPLFVLSLALAIVIIDIGSLIASFSNSIPMLLAGESIIEGIAAALMMPATASWRREE
jgi:hypothetical protein